MLKRFIFVFVCLFLFVTAEAIDTISLKQNFTEVDLKTKFEFLETHTDYTWPWQVENVIGWKKQKYSELFIENPSVFYWVRFKLDNLSGDFNVAMLSLDNTSIDNIDIYLINSTEQRILEKVWYTGLNIGINSKPYPAPNFVIPLPLKQDSSYEVYLKLKNSHPTFIPLKIINNEKYAADITSTKIFIGMVSGLVILALIYSFLVLSFLREKRYIYYTIFFASLLGLSSFLSGAISLFGIMPSNVDYKKLYFCVSYLFYMGLVFSIFDVFKQLNYVRKFIRHSIWIYLYLFSQTVLCWFLSFDFNISFTIAFICILFSFVLTIFKFWNNLSFFHKIFLSVLTLFLLCWFGNFVTRFGLFKVFKVLIITDSTISYFSAFASLAMCVGMAYRLYSEKRVSRNAGDLSLYHERLQEDIFNFTTEGVFVIDLNGRIVRANNAFFEILNYLNIKDFSVKFVDLDFRNIFVNKNIAEDLLTNAIFAIQEKTIKQEINEPKPNNNYSKKSIEVICKEGNTKNVLVSLNLLTEAKIFKSERFICGILVDVDKNFKLTDKLDYLLEHDSLTNLYNRSYMQKQIENCFKHVSNPGCFDYFAFLDIDRFKSINNACGTNAGDLFLAKIGEDLKIILPNAIVARMGGDEFGVLLQNTNAHVALQICETIRSYIQEQRFKYNDNCYGLTVSIGLTYVQENLNASSVIAIGEVCCGTAKSKGRNCVNLYSALSREITNYTKEFSWIATINRALEQRKFMLYKQSIAINEASKNDKSIEIFTRMLGDTGSIIPAKSFMSIAEKYGFVINIDSWLIGSIDQWLTNLQSEDLINYNAIFLNISLASISSQHIQRKLERIFSKATYPLNLLCFEISENYFKKNFENVNNFISLLRKYNCRVVFDQFECGISSYNLIKVIQPDFIKIDADSLCELRSHATTEVLKAMKLMLEQERKKIILKHVNNVTIYEDFEFLKFYGYQGYAFDRPSPLEI